MRLSLTLVWQQDIQIVETNMLGGVWQLVETPRLFCRRRGDGAPFCISANDAGQKPPSIVRSDVPAFFLSNLGALEFHHVGEWVE